MPTPLKIDPNSWASKYVDPKSVYISGYEQQATGTYRTNADGEPEAITEDDKSRPIYAAPMVINGQKFVGTYNADGGFAGALGEHKKNDDAAYFLTPEGKVEYLPPPSPGMKFEDFLKMVAPMAINLAFPGLGTTIGSALGAGATFAPVVGGAVLGGGFAGLTGGNVLQGVISGGLGGAANLKIGDTGFTMGDLTKGANVLNAAKNGDVFGAISGAASMSGLSTDIPIGDTGYTLSDLTKNAKLAQAVLSGNPKAVIGAITQFAGAVQANSTNTPTEDQFNTQSQNLINSLAPYESKDPNALIDLAVGNQQTSAAADQPAIDARTQDIIKQLEQSGLTQDDFANTDWAALHATPTTNPATGETIVGGDPSQIANQNLNIDQAQLDSFNKNFQGIIDNGGYTSQWQTSGGDRVMIADDGTGIGINQDGDPYALTKDQVNQMIQNGQLNTANSGYVAATGGTGTTPGGSGANPSTSTPGTKTTTPTAGTPKAGTPTAGTSTSSAPAAASTASPTVTRLGVDPLEVIKLAGLNDVAHIKSFKELFGHELFGDDKVPASSAQDQNVPEADVLKALEDTSNYASGGDIHALLQLLRS